MEVRLTQIYGLLLMGETKVKGVQLEMGLSGCSFLRNSHQSKQAMLCQSGTSGVLTWGDHLVAAYAMNCWTFQQNVTESEQLVILHHHKKYEKLRMEGCPTVRQVDIRLTHVDMIDEWCLTRAMGLDTTYWEENPSLWFQLTRKKVRILSCIQILTSLTLSLFLNVLDC